MSVDVLISGLERTTSTQVEIAVRRTFRQARIEGDWNVALLPSDRDGRWDLGVNGPSGWYITWFDAAVDELASRVVEQVRQRIGS